MRCIAIRTIAKTDALTAPLDYRVLIVDLHRIRHVMCQLLNSSASLKGSTEPVKAPAFGNR
jgi:hypothetical protein